MVGMSIFKYMHIHTYLGANGEYMYKEITTTPNGKERVTTRIDRAVERAVIFEYHFNFMMNSPINGYLKITLKDNG